MADGAFVLWLVGIILGWLVIGIYLAHWMER